METSELLKYITNLNNTLTEQNCNTVTSFVNWYDINGVTPLMFVCANINLFDKYELIIYHLQCCDAKINMQDSDGDTALSTVVMSKNCGGIQRNIVINLLLLDAECDLSIKDIDGENVLMKAVGNQLGTSIIETLCDFGIDLNAQDDNGMTVMMHVLELPIMCFENGYAQSVIKVLEEFNMDISLRDCEGLDFQDYIKKNNLERYFNSKNINNMTPTCVICLENLAIYANVPCFHLIYCDKCVLRGSSYSECMICKNNVETLQRIYY
jgi:hypothetical protein